MVRVKECDCRADTLADDPAQNAAITLSTSPATPPPASAGEFNAAL
jgi:hypothetical protein